MRFFLVRRFLFLALAAFPAIAEAVDCDGAYPGARPGCRRAIVKMDRLDRDYAQGSRFTGRQPCPEHAIRAARQEGDQSVYRCVKGLGSHSRIADEVFALAVGSTCALVQSTRYVHVLERRCKNPGPAPDPNAPTVPIPRF